jgi:hypothetical protein
MWTVKGWNAAREAFPSMARQACVQDKSARAEIKIPAIGLNFSSEKRDF